MQWSSIVTTTIGGALAGVLAFLVCLPFKAMREQTRRMIFACFLGVGIIVTQWVIRLKSEGTQHDLRAGLAGAGAGQTNGEKGPRKFDDSRLEAALRQAVERARPEWQRISDRHPFKADADKALGEALTRKGTARLSDQELVEFFRLQGLLATSATKPCIGMWRGTLTDDDVVQFLKTLSDDDLSLWFSLTTRAMFLEASASSPRIEVLRTSFVGAISALSWTLEEHERKRVASAFEDAKSVGDDEGCWVLRAVFANAFRLDLPSRRIFMRGLASPDAIENVADNDLDRHDRACVQGDMIACHNLSLLQKEQGQRDSAGRNAGRACDGGLGTACASFGATLLLHGDTTEAKSKGLELLERSCRENEVSGCSALGVAYLKGLGTRQDARRAAEAYRRGCDVGESSSCRNLGVLYYDGHGVQRDFVHAAALFDRACRDDDAMSCGNLARSYAQGLGVRKDLSSARAMQDKACTGGNKKSCQEHFQ